MRAFLRNQEVKVSLFKDKNTVLNSRHLFKDEEAVGKKKKLKE